MIIGPVLQLKLRRICWLGQAEFSGALSGQPFQYPTIGNSCIDMDR